MWRCAIAGRTVQSPEGGEGRYLDVGAVLNQLPVAVLDNERTD
jgi:hypothetical protein